MTGVPPVVELLTREGCGLCEKARAALEPLAVECGFRVVSIDIDDDPALLRAYDWRIPVVRSGGRDLCEGRITEEDLRLVLSGVGA